MSIRAEVTDQPPYSYDRPPPHRVKLDQNESPYDLPDALKRRALKRIEALELNRYPSVHAEALAQALAAYESWPADGVVVAGGSNILIQAAVAACALGRSVVTVTPTFPLYAIQAKLFGAELIEVPLTSDFALPVEALTRALDGRYGVLFLTSPAAPTGNVHGEPELRAVIEAAAPNCTVVVDEAYHQFADTDHLNLVRDYDHVVSLRTFSKAFGLAGARIGYLLAAAPLARELAKLPLPFSVSTPQQAIALTVLEAPQSTRRYIDEVKRERPRLQAELAQLPGVRVYPSSANFVLFKVDDAGKWYRELAERGVLIRRQDRLGGLEGCLRVSLGRPRDNDAFLIAARDVARQSAPEAASG